MKNTLPKFLRRFTLLIGLLGVMFYSEDAFAQKKKKKDSKNTPAATTPPARPQNGGNNHRQHGHGPDCIEHRIFIE